MHAAQHAGTADGARRGISFRQVHAGLKTKWRSYLARREARSAFSDPRLPPVLIYRMGKVGSRTVYTSLKAAAVAQPVLAVHFISDDVHTLRRRRGNEHPGDAIPLHYLLGAAIGDELRRRPGAPCQVISLVREPIAFAVSNFFQKPQLARENVWTDRGEIDADKAVSYLTKKFRRGGGTNYIDNWFDRELKGVFGVDVYATPFPVDRGYAVYQRGSVEALVLRLEDLSEKGPQVLADFLGLDGPVPLIRSNDRLQSRDAAAYRRVIERLRVDRRSCEKMYACRVARHFYGEDMIGKFVSHWSREDVP